MTVHDDLAIGRNFSESTLDFVHRNIHRTRDAAFVDKLGRLAYVQQERRGAFTDQLREPARRYRLHL